MIQTFKEPVPKTEYLLQPGDIILSAGKTFIYRIISAPVCKLYRDSDKPGTYEPYKNESSWYDTGCSIKGWRRSGPNFPSYYVEIFNTDTLETAQTSITLRWIPIKVTLSEALDIVKATKLQYRSSDRSVEEIDIPKNVIKNMKSYTTSNVDFCCD